MAQTLTGSYSRPAGLSKAGVKAIGFAPFNVFNRLATTSAGVVDLETTFGTTPFIARFEIRNTTSTYTETDTIGMDTLAGEIAGTFPFTLPIPPSQTERLKIANIVEKFRQNTKRWVCFLELNDGTIKAIGSQFGCEVFTGTNATGGTGQDLNGYTINVTTKEFEHSDLYVLSGTGLTEYADAIMATV
jgi:hypothetical protein